ncbi:MAG: HNH endonuclease [Opitutaceae bacterium]|nr:HNH endonuclease [Opitutaceae bacterium]
MSDRKHIPIDITTAVLTQAGYRCAVPTCRGILALDLHHIVEVSEGGGDTSDNLLALCPTCHALYHRKVIRRESIRAWKTTLMALSHAFDKRIDRSLLFLE